jgi:hypothetical protein
MKTTYFSAKERIRKSTTIEQLDKLDVSLERLYKIGVFSLAQFGTLDLMIMDKKIALEEE